MAIKDANTPMPTLSRDEWMTILLGINQMITSCIRQQNAKNARPQISAVYKAEELNLRNLEAKIVSITQTIPLN